MENLSSNVSFIRASALNLSSFQHDADQMAVILELGKVVDWNEPHVSDKLEPIPQLHHHSMVR